MDLHSCPKRIHTTSWLFPKGKGRPLFLETDQALGKFGQPHCLSYQFQKDKREIYVEGEVYLEVTKDKTRPFIVSTNKMNIAVLGTSFNVTAYTADKEQSVVLVTGAVR